ncbi:MAG: 3-phosphoshikimate 1-carboxyvinyltransferase [Proteobacteria bacterium]|jgi:3-phosphoshikimate 1-carboxyvinyltransferase|nr:3-phosphoshikimate 1-carboxyvinyltransferase [Pseudomonadota bacterium]
MSNPIINKQRVFKKTIKIPGDKSISHRSIILGSIAKGKTEITNFLNGEDCICTQKAFESLGVEIETNFHDPENPIVKIHGKGIEFLRAPNNDIYLGNSGTGMRLLAGLFSGLNFKSVLTGDESLSSRPMKRVIDPLSLMGANIESSEGKAPLIIHGTSNLKGISYKSPVSSAQVKSSLLLAGLNADGVTTIIEPEKSRDHSERMLDYFQSPISYHHGSLEVSIRRPEKPLQAQRVKVPGDISSASFFMVAAAIVEDAEVELLNVGINPTRTGIIDVLTMMNVDFSIHNLREEGKEPIADIIVKSSNIKACEISGDIIPRLIDEIPVIAILAAQAQGTTVIKNAEELKVKESNRIATTVKMLKGLGVNVEETDDGMIIEGLAGRDFPGGDASIVVIDSKGDHRIAMSSAIAGLHSAKPVEILKSEFVNTSFPSFFKYLGLSDVLR